MNPPDTEPGAPTRRRGLRAAIAAAAVVGVWASMWAIGRSGITTPQAESHATPTSPPAVGQGGFGIPPTFAHAAGWSVRTSGVVAPGSRSLPMAVVANVPFARQDETFMAAHGVTESAPTATISSLPPGGVVIVAVLPFPSGGGPAPPHFGDFPDRRLPLRLSDGRINRQWSAQPRPNAPEYDVWGRVDGTYVEVAVYFGAARPRAATYAAAQAELTRLVLPPLPNDQTPSPPRWTTADDGGLTIQTPPSWTFSAAPSFAELAEGNWPFPGGGSCGPDDALRSMPRDGALLWLSETILATGERGFSPRPAQFSLRGRRPVARECAGSAYVFQFRDRGRFFQAQIAFGPDASVATRTLALRSLSSLRVGSDAG